MSFLSKELLTYLLTIISVWELNDTDERDPLLIAKNWLDLSMICVRIFDVNIQT